MDKKVKAAIDQDYEAYKANIDYESYDTQLELNNSKMAELVKTMFPDLTVPYEEIYKILSYLEETKVNPQIIPAIIRGIHNVSIGSGIGQVVAHVKEDKVNISVREQNDEIQVKLTQTLEIVE